MDCSIARRFFKLVITLNSKKLLFLLYYTVQCTTMIGTVHHGPYSTTFALICCLLVMIACTKYNVQCTAAALKYSGTVTTTTTVRSFGAFLPHPPPPP